MSAYRLDDSAGGFQQATHSGDCDRWSERHKAVVPLTFDMRRGRKQAELA